MLARTEREPLDGAEVRRWYHSYGLLVVLAVGLSGTALLVASAYHLPVRDPDDSLVGPVYVRLPLIALGCFLADVLVRALRRRDPGGLKASVPAVVRERWSAPRVRLVLVGLLSWYLTYVAFRNLKSYVPFVRPDMVDGDLLRIDRALALGQDPANVLHDVLGVGPAAHLMSVTYVAWILFLSMSLLIALFWTRNLAVASWYVTAVAVNWVLGAALYYLVPSVGPIYAKPSLFSDLPELPTTAIARTWMDDRIAMLADPFGTPALQTVAAFASLHVSVMVTAALVAWFGRLRPISLHWALWFFLLLNVLATVYLGWHYVVDVFGGVGVGVAAVWVAAYGTGNKHRLPRLRAGRSGTDTGSSSTAPSTSTGYARPESERFWTPPTVVTATRTVGSVAVTLLALQQRSVALLFVGLAIYWVGDIADGWLARRLDRETRTGGVTDILCDRVCAGLFYVGVLVLLDLPPVPVLIYLAEFMVVDLALSLAFLAWPLVSPNYFYLVDRPVWLVNWSPVAKSLNSAAFLAALLTGSTVAAASVAITLLLVKSLSLARVARLRLPARSRSAVPVLHPSRTPTG